jgi:hypothetical protein
MGAGSACNGCAWTPFGVADFLRFQRAGPPCQRDNRGTHEAITDVVMGLGAAPSETGKFSTPVVPAP